MRRIIQLMLAATLPMLIISCQPNNTIGESSSGTTIVSISRDSSSPTSFIIPNVSSGTKSSRKSFEHQGNRSHDWIKENALSLSDSEIEEYIKNLPSITARAAELTKDWWEHNNTFYRRHGVSPYWPPSKTYENEYFDAMKIKYLRDDLAHRGKSALLKEMKVSDCTVMTVRILGQAFKEKNLEHVHERVIKFAKSEALRLYGSERKNSMYGLLYLKGLRHIGWKVYYYNAATNYREAMELQNTIGGKGYHGNYFWNVVVRKGNYEKDSQLPIDDRTTFLGMKEPPINLSDITYCLAVGNTGYHVWTITKGDAIEGHRSFSHLRQESVERGKFNPYGTLNPIDNKYDGKKGGRKYGPANLGDPYLSGVITIPPNDAF